MSRQTNYEGARSEVGGCSSRLVPGMVNRPRAGRTAAPQVQVNSSTARRDSAGPAGRPDTRGVELGRFVRGWSA